MLVSDDYRHDYLRIKKIKIGASSMNLKFKNLKNTIEDLYDIKVIEIEERTSDLEKRVKIEIWVESTDQIKNLGICLGNEVISIENPSNSIFEEYLNTPNIQNIEVDGLFGRKIKRKPKRSELSLTFKSFQSIAICSTECLIPQNRIRKLIEEVDIPEIYDIPRSVIPKTIFVYKDSQIHTVQNSKKLVILAQKYLDLWKEYDYFDYLKKRKKINFSVESKEKFENIYGGSWFRYTQ